MIHTPRSPEILFGSMEEVAPLFFHSNALSEAHSIICLVDENVAGTVFVSKLILKLKSDRKCAVLCDGFSEPTLKKVENCYAFVQNNFKGVVDAIVAIGGGSTIDTAKLTSILVAMPEFNLPSVFTTSLPFNTNPISVIAVPTTIGPGAEISPAAIYDGGKGKIGIVDERLVPTLATIIPDLTKTLPKAILACSIADGIAHSLEGILSLRSTPMSDAMHGSALKIFLAEVEQVLSQHSDPLSWHRLCEASIMSGIATRITGVNIIHMLAGILIRISTLSHGASVLMSMVAVLEEIGIKDSDVIKHLDEMIGCLDAAYRFNKLMKILCHHIKPEFNDIKSVKSLNKDFLFEQKERLAECKLKVELDDVLSIAQLLEVRMRSARKIPFCNNDTV